jgi:hypothetical protein
MGEKSLPESSRVESRTIGEKLAKAIVEKHFSALAWSFIFLSPKSQIKFVVNGLLSVFQLRARISLGLFSLKLTFQE